MSNQDLYTAICQGNVKDSIYLATGLLLKDPDKNIDILHEVFIAAVSYIGSFISVLNIRLWLNVVQNLIDFIESDKVVIKDMYVLISKMCLLCDMYVKQPIVKTGTISLKILREKIIDMFENDTFKLTMTGMGKFEGIIPPIDSPSYALAQQIITGYVYFFKQLGELSNENSNKIADMANKIRNSFDYIVRKKYTFETKFYESDNDGIWFLWGIISLLFNEYELDILYQLFCFEYKKKTKGSRIGLLWGASVVMVYLTKKDIARNWNQAELKAIQKIEDISLILYNDIRKEMVHSGQLQVAPKNNSINGIDYISGYKPSLRTDNTNVVEDVSEASENETKYIKCRNKYMT